MTALSARPPGAPVDTGDPEAVARRSLGLDALFCAIVGGLALVGGRRIARSVALPPWVVRTAGMGTLSWAGAVGWWSVAEEWQAPTRRVLVANTAGAAALLGHSATRGTPAGRTGVAGLAAAVAGVAGVQRRALLADQPQPHS
ncbi:MAG TPA: hypothetical protein VMM13_18585 [Euzebya sp.]|nr:hypothetical protein [Euzebya sp.]